MARASSTRLTFQAEITPSRFSEVGRPYLIKDREDGRLVALCSAFDTLQWPGRAVASEGRCRHRVSLYTGELDRRVAMLDVVRYPINDVAFHPSAPWLAIGAGCYDGGYMFEGELVLWNWETGEHRSLLGESREVVACRFVDADRLAIVLRPRHEDEYDAADEFAIYLGVILDDLRSARELGMRGDPDPRLADLEPVDPAVLGFSVPTTPASSLDPRELLRLTRLGFEERHHVWDVAWIDAARVAVVHDGCQLEVWRLSGEREVDVRGGGHGVQLFALPDRLLVHVLRREVSPDRELRGAVWLGKPAGVRSTLAELRTGSLVEWLSFDRACAFSIDRHGRVLARDVERSTQQARSDRVLDAAGGLIIEADLGHYDVFNHYIRLDGGDELYFLRGTPPSSHQAKRLCAIDASGTIRERMIWDRNDAHETEACGVLGPHNAILRAVRTYPVDQRGPRRSPRYTLELYPRPEARALWACEVDATVTAMALAAEPYVVILALGDGRLAVIDASTGTWLHDEPITAGDVPTVATALACHDGRVIVGTIDGRLLLYALDGGD